MATRTLRVYLAYAEGDERCRDLLVSEALREKLAVDFLYMPAKQPWVPRWKCAFPGFRAIATICHRRGSPPSSPGTHAMC